MKILITGSNGLLGQKLIHLLKEKSGYQVVAVSRGGCRFSLPEGMKYQSCDLSSETAFSTMVHQENPDVVIHAAAMTNVDECELNPEECRTQNVEVVKNVIAACEKTEAHLIHLSTDFIFDGLAGPYREEDIPNPISVYGHSKLDAENLVRAATCPWTIVRTILVYGIAPGLSRSNIVLWVKSNLEQGREIQVVDDQFRTPTLAEDLAAGCLLIAEKRATGIFNISGKEVLSPYEMAILTADYFQLDNSLIKKADSSTFSQPAKRPPKTGFDISKAEKMLAYRPHTFKEGIQILHAQMR